MDFLEHVEHNAVQGGGIILFCLFGKKMRPVKVIKRVNQHNHQHPDEHGGSEDQTSLEEAPKFHGLKLKIDKVLCLVVVAEEKHREQNGVANRPPQRARLDLQ